MQYKHLLIDLDGTLLGSWSLRLHWLFTRQFAKSLQKQGIPFWRALSILHRQKLRMHDHDHQKNGSANLAKYVRFFSELSGLPMEKSEHFIVETAGECFRNAESAFYVIPEAQNFVKWAEGKYTLILATNPQWTEKLVRYRLGLAGIPAESFRFITHAENMSACKPHVSYYEELLEKCGLRREECLMIGNDERKDRPAEKTGIDVVILKKHSDFIDLQKRLSQQEVSS